MLSWGVENTLTLFPIRDTKLMNGLNGWGVFEWEYGIQAYLWESWMVKTRQSQSYISNLKEYIKYVFCLLYFIKTVK